MSREETCAAPRIRAALAGWIAGHDLARERVGCELLLGHPDGVTRVTLVAAGATCGVTVGIPRAYELFPAEDVAAVVDGVLTGALDRARALGRCPR